VAEIPRLKRFRSRRLLNAAEGQPCVLCERNDGTTIPAHLPGAFYGMAAGTGQKTHDWLVAHVCHVCHNNLDTVMRRNADVRLRALCLTLQRLFDQGVLTVLDSRHARTGDDDVVHDQEKNSRGLDTV
jgi:hypothetical protein